MAERLSVKLSISLPPEHARVLRELAAAFDGNVSGTIAYLLETHAVTKSEFPSSFEATNAA